MFELFSWLNYLPKTAELKMQKVSYNKFINYRYIKHLFKAYYFQRAYVRAIKIIRFLEFNLS